MGMFTRASFLLRWSTNRVSSLRVCCSINFPRCINYYTKKKLSRIMKLETRHFHSSITILSRSGVFYNVSAMDDVAVKKEENEEKSENIRNPYSSYPHENEYARNFFENSINYSKTMYIPPKVKVIVSDDEVEKLLSKDWSSATLEELFEGLRRLSYHALCNGKDFEMEQYNCILQCLKLKIYQCNDFMLQNILYALVPLYSKLYKNNNLQQLCNKLDAQCEIRYSKWSTQHCLLMSDLIYCLHHHHRSYFIMKFLRRITFKLNHLTPKDIVRLMYLVNVIRKSKLNMYEVEVQLERCMNDITINELGIVAMGFFKSKSKIRNSEFLKTIINYTIQELNRVEDIPLTALVKLIRYSVNVTFASNFHILLKAIEPQIPSRSLMCLAHLAHACANLTIYEKGLMDAIIMRLNNGLKEARLKDIERILFSLTTLNIDSSNPVYNNVIEEITTGLQGHRALEIEKYPYILTRILLFCSYMKIYPIHLIEYAFNPEVVQRSCKGCVHKLGLEYTMLEHNIKIEVPHYSGPFLKDGIRNHLVQFHTTQKAPGRLNNLITEVLHLCKQIYSSEILPYADQLMPHYLLKDIVVGLDQNGNAVPVEPFLSAMPTNTIKRVDNLPLKDITWIALVCITENCLIRGSYEPSRNFHVKMRLLRTIGYTPIMIFENVLNKNLNEESKQIYIKDLIDSAHSTVMNERSIA